MKHYLYECTDPDSECEGEEFLVGANDRKAARQIAYHLVKAGTQSNNASEETKQELSKIVDFANGFHRVGECGKIALLDYGCCPRCHSYNVVMAYNPNNKKYQVICMDCQFRSLSSKSKRKAKRNWKQKIFHHGNFS